MKFVITSIIIVIIALVFKSSQAIQPKITTEEPQIQPTPLPSPPFRYQLSGGTHAFQTFNNCGPAALSIALSYLGMQVSQQELGKELRPYQYPPGDNDDKSVTLDELSLKAADFGFGIYHRPAGTIELIKQLVSQDIPVITRTWLHKGEDIGHYRVITGYDDMTNELIQDDSYQGGGLRFAYTDFLALWQAFNYEFLIVVPKEKQQSVEVQLGRLKDKQEAWKQALELAEQEVNKNPKDVYSQFNQSVALYENNQYQESVNIFEKIKHQLPDRMLWYQLEPIYAYYFLGDYDRVFEETHTILEGGNRSNAELYYLLALIYNKQNNQELADKHIKLADTYNNSTYWKKSIEEELIK